MRKNPYKNTYIRLSSKPISDNCSLRTVCEDIVKTNDLWLSVGQTVTEFVLKLN